MKTNTIELPEFVHTWEDQLNVGERGEKQFVIDYSELNPTKSIKDLRWDFDLGNGAKVELKTDSYRMHKSMNFFMEKIGDTTTNKLGGPWRALNDDVDYFVYYFFFDRTYFWFNPLTLVHELEQLIYVGEAKKSYVTNDGWQTMGYLVPRHFLNHVLIAREVQRDD